MFLTPKIKIKPKVNRKTKSALDQNGNFMEYIPWVNIKLCLQKYQASKSQHRMHIGLRF